MQNVHIATVGRSPEPILMGFRLHPVDHQVLLHSEGAAEVARRLRRQIQGLAGPGTCELVAIDPFDMHDVVGKIVEVSERFKGARVSVNITGGTNVMASAALVACFTIGAEAFYFKEPQVGEAPSLEDHLVRLPVPKVPLSEIRPAQRSILVEVRTSGVALRKATSVLSRRLQMSPQLVSYHLRRLRGKGLIEMTVVGRDKLVSLTDAGRLYAGLLGPR